MAERIPKSATIRVPLQAYLSSDHVTPATGKTIPITISKNGAAYGNPSGGATNAVEIANGSYYVDISTTDTGTLGPLWVLGILTGIDNVLAIYNVVDPAVKLTSAGLDDVVVEAGLNARQALAVTAAGIGGSISGATSIGGTVTIFGAGVTAARAVMTGSAAGNRTGITLTPPA